jgi:glycosyltransferase involved in cell wall biosynthesis
MISVLIPIYNGIEFIDESVMSVINQSYTNWELLIGINGHPENSQIYKIAKEYENKCNKIRVYDFFNIKGKSTTLNEMLKFCQYNYVAILDVDDIWYNKKLEIQSRFLNKYDVIGTQCIYFGEKNDIVPPIPINDISNFDFTRVNPIINSSSVIRKELCFWDKKWDGVEDYDLWLKLRNLDKKFYNCDEILVKHRIHNTSAFNANGNNLLVSDLLKKHSK